MNFSMQLIVLFDACGTGNLMMQIFSNIVFLYKLNVFFRKANDMRSVLLIVLTILLASCSKTSIPPTETPIDSSAVMSKGMTPLPSPLHRNYGSGKFNRVAVELTNGTILVAGGYTYDDMSRKWGQLPTEIYDTTTKKWTELPPLVKGTQSQDKIFLLNDGRVFFKYGITADGISLDEGLFYFSIFNPTTKTWEMKYNPASFTDRSPIQDCCLLPDGTVFILATDYHYVWNPWSDTYTEKVNNKYDATSARCVRLANGEVLVCGGKGSGSTTPTDYCFLYPSYKTCRMLSRKSVIDLVATDDNKAYILVKGNEKSNGTQYSSPYQYYDYATNSWNAINTNLTTDGYGVSQGSVVFPSNKCFVMSEGFGAVAFSVFDFTTQKVIPNRIFEYSVAPIAKKLALFIRLRTGKIFVLGYDPSGKLPECYLYDSRVDYP